jgi:poly-gamma-glutamate capsule biosynthesis protein CapA/YwtB (metallophosphatase superfamily)
VALAVRVALRSGAAYMPGAALARSSDRAAAVALSVVLVCAGRRARTRSLAVAGVRDAIRLLVRLATPIVADLRADALADAAIVPRRARCVAIDIGGTTLVPVAANLVLARRDYFARRSVPARQGCGFW